MSADLQSDPNIHAAYAECHNVDSPIDWFYLGYAPQGPKDKLVLVSRGEGGLEGFKASFASSSAPAAIHFGLLRLEGRFLLITVLPEDAGGVKRARALVHSRAVGANFAHQASVTIARPDELALGTVRSKLRLDSGSAPSSLPPSPNPGAGGLASPSFSHNTQAAAGRSPLRSYFPGHSPKLSQHPNGPHGQHVYNAQASPRDVSDPVRNGQQLSDDAPPPIPVKEGADLNRMNSKASLRNRSPRLGSRSPQPPSPQVGSGSHPNIFGNRSASASSSPASGLGLGLPASNGVGPYHDTGNVRMYAASESAGSSLSPRLAAMGITQAHTADGRTASSPTPPSSASAVQTSFDGPARAVADSSRAPEVTSPTHPGTSLKAEQSLPLPPAEGDRSVPTSAKSLEESTLASMFGPSAGDEQDGDASVDSIQPPRRSEGDRTRGHVPRASLGEVTDEERQAVAEALARETEQRWQAARAAERAAVEVAEREEAEKERVKQEERQRLDAAEAAQLVEAREAREAEERAVAEAAEQRRVEEEERLQLERKKEEERSRLEEETRAREEQERKEAERVEALERAEREKVEAKAKSRDDLKARLSGSAGPESADRVALTGFVSVQGGASIIWRRRYFEMTRSRLNLFKSDKDTSSAPIDHVDLSSGRIGRIEGSAEELMAIPYSFKIVFRVYDEEPILFYCDEQEDKELLVLAISTAAGL